MYTKKLAKDKHTFHQLSYTKKYKITKQANNYYV